MHGWIFNRHYCRKHISNGPRKETITPSTFTTLSNTKEGGHNYIGSKTTMVDVYREVITSPKQPYIT